MKKLLIIAVSLILFTTAEAKISFGIRGGYNATTLTFSADNWSTGDRNGFYVGPTVKIGLPVGFGLDLSAVYDQRTVNSSYHDQGTSAEVTDKRKTLAVPLNLRYNFGLGSSLSIFAFAGPEFDFSLNKDIDEAQFKWSWSKSTYSVNVGAGITLLSHLEIRASYNIPCGDTSTISFPNAYNNAIDGIKAKTGAWQVGAAIYF